jgi:hypothetical protein
MNQNKLKQTYNSNYVQQVYRERGFQELEEALKNFLSYEGWNNELKKKCVDKLIKNLQQVNNSDTIIETYSDYMNVCSSIKSFITGLDQTSQSKRAQDYITVACGYETNLSSRRLAMIIGVDRDRIDKLNRGINDYLVEEAAAVTEEPDDHILDDEPPLSDDGSDNDDEDDIIDTNSDNEGAEVVTHNDGAEQQDRANSAQPVLHALQRIMSSRKQR